MLIELHDPQAKRDNRHPAERVRGLMTSSGFRYAVNLGWNGTRLNGRLGGVILGETVQLEHDGNALLGTVSSGTVRLAVHARFTPDEHDSRTGKLELRLCGLGYINTASVTIHGDCVTGSVQANGTSLEIKLALTRSTLEGHIGNAGLAQHVRLERDSVPGFVMVTAALMVDAVSREVSRALMESLERMREA